MDNPFELSVAEERRSQLCGKVVEATNPVPVKHALALLGLMSPNRPFAIGRLKRSSSGGTE